MIGKTGKSNMQINNATIILIYGELEETKEISSIFKVYSDKQKSNIQSMLLNISCLNKLY